jgi:predicted nucleic acid-binding protein
MKFLLDTNIFIPLEPSAFGEVHPRSEVAARLLRLLVEGGHQYYVHPELKTDLSRDRDLGRQRQREVVRAKYPMLRSPPKAPDTWKPLAGDPAPGTNDWVDIAHLAAVYHDAVDYLVTEDLRLRRKSRKVDLGERVVSVDEAQCVLLRAGFYSCGRLAPPLPSTPACLAHKDPAW